MEWAIHRLHSLGSVSELQHMDWNKCLKLDYSINEINPHPQRGGEVPKWIQLESWWERDCEEAGWNYVVQYFVERNWIVPIYGYKLGLLNRRQLHNYHCKCKLFILNRKYNLHIFKWNDSRRAGFIRRPTYYHFYRSGKQNQHHQRNSSHVVLGK